MNNIKIGIDSGSRTTKIVVYDSGKREIIFSNIVDSGINPKRVSGKILEDALKLTGISEDQILTINSTGYGRNVVSATNRAISEISCHAKGVHFFHPDVRTVIDIGGQDSKVISINEQGKVAEFAMNDKCAAGTGRFLEVVGTILGTTVEELSGIAETADKEISISSTCVVFAESEIIGLISSGETKGNIIRSVHYSIAKRVANLLTQIAIFPPIAFTGGVAHNLSLAEAISSQLGKDVIIVKNPDITGALGAAILD